MLALASVVGLLIPQMTFLTAIAITSPFDTGILGTLGPIFTMFVAYFFVGEPITGKRERLIVDEVNANNVETAIDWDRCLEGLQETCRKTCDMFGIPAEELNVTWRDIATPDKATAEEVEVNAE